MQTCTNPQNLGNLEKFGNLYLGTFTWEPSEPLLGNLGNWEPLLGNLGNLWEPLLGNFEMRTLRSFTWNLGNLANFGEAWEPLLGNLGNLYLGILGTFLGNFGNLYLGNLGNLYSGTLETLETLGESVSELLRSAPKPLLWLKTPKLLLLGKKWMSQWVVWAKRIFASHGLCQFISFFFQKS